MSDNKVSKFLGLSTLMFNYNKDVPISSDGLPSWDFIMPMVDKIENLDLSDYFYKWEQDGKMKSNFMSVEFMMDRCGCDYNKYGLEIFINLELDPALCINKSPRRYKSRKMAFITAITEFLEYYDKLIEYDKRAETEETGGGCESNEIDR